ncbi:hypothetical protein BC830DRAFT_1215832 [Chytriomyces sp. MP71]|nr:hypothetical protein BC830DRAFT_1215832 [Chytriomyces sp. MP71]
MSRAERRYIAVLLLTLMSCMAVSAVAQEPGADKAGVVPVVDDVGDHSPPTSIAATQRIAIEASATSISSTYSAKTPVPSAGAMQTTQKRRTGFERRAVYLDLFSTIVPGASVVFERDSINSSEMDQIQGLYKDTLILPFKGTRFFCMLPDTRELKGEMRRHGEDVDPTELAIDDNERAINLLDGFNQGCLNWTSNFWIYSYCHKEKVIQYSNFPANYPPVQYLLGEYKEVPSQESFTGNRQVAAKGGAELVDADGDGNRYLKIPYAEGDRTMCENGLKRSVEVQFSCCKTQHIASVIEPTTCNYIMRVHTPVACDNVFKSKPLPTIPQTEIVCVPIDDNPQPHETKPPMGIESKVPFQSMIRSSCIHPAICSSQPRTSTSLEQLDSLADTSTEQATRTDPLQGSAAAGIHPDQHHVLDDAFDTLWLDEYDPLYLDQNEMRRVLQHANALLDGLHAYTAEGEVSSEFDEDEGDEDGPEVLVDEEEPQDPLALVAAELQKARMELWRTFVVRKDESDQSMIGDESGLAFEGEGDLLNFDVWEAAADEVPDEAVDVLARFRQ